MNRVATLTQSRDAEENSGSLVPSGFYRERRALGLCRGSTPSRLQVDSFRMDFFFFGDPFSSGLENVHSYVRSRLPFPASCLVDRIPGC